MRLMSIDIHHSQFDTAFLNEAQEKLAIVQAALQSTQAQKYENPYSFAWLPADQQALDEVIALAQKKQTLNVDALVLIGIGGSNLGALAIYQALRHQLKNKPTLYVADTIDAFETEILLQQLELLLQAGKKIMVMVVTKSGTTLETLVNAGLIIELLKKYDAQNYQDFVVAITQKNSQLWQWAVEQHISVLPIWPNISGRFSVFSAVGLLPLALLGINIQEVLAGAQSMFEWCKKSSNPEINPAARDALLLFTHYKLGRDIHNTFVFIPALAELANWYRQLLAESIGKRNTIDNQEIDVGIVPITSLATTDLHSQFQLYMAGPDIIFTSFLYASQVTSSVRVPENSSFLSESVRGKTIDQLQKAIFSGVAESYIKHQRPFVTYDFVALSPEIIGQWMQLKMLSTVYLAALFNINAFDQPEVESYKTAARRSLEK